ncbi:hypothetical protein [Cedecea davisae]|uniref:hypothetical protein n=1 Tax=Cedecea davisae TaxID=158484 RepID=UPI002430585A|nr:hypothetical protein [Cedecea davisae]
MPISAVQHRSSARIRENSLYTQKNRRLAVKQMIRARNAPDVMSRESRSHASLFIRAGIPLLLLSQQLQWPGYALHRSSNPPHHTTSPPNGALTETQNLPSLSSSRLYNTPIFTTSSLNSITAITNGSWQRSIAEPSSSILLPGAYSAPLLNVNNDVVWESKSGNYIISSEQKQNELFTQLKQYLVSNGEMSAEEGEGFEFSLRVAAAGNPVLIIPLGEDSGNSSRIKRELVDQDNPRIAEHIKNHCAFEEEVLNARGENQGKLLLFKAQRAENPFRMIFDNTDGRPTASQRGVADGLNIVANILTFGLKPWIGGIIAAAFRQEHYSNINDNICAKRQWKIIQAEMATNIDASSIPYSRKGMSRKVKPTELRNILPYSNHAAFYIQNPASDIRRGILLELKQGKLSLNTKGHSIYLKPTDKPNEFIAHNTGAAATGQSKRKVIIDEDNFTWRYADMLDSDALDVDIHVEKQHILVHGEYHELNLNSAGHYEILVKKKSGITESIPVYQEPISAIWHLSVQNGKKIFSKKQEDLIKSISVRKDESHSYVKEENNNHNYYGLGKLYRERKYGDYSNGLGIFVEMNGELIPVRERSIPHHGARYEAFNSAEDSFLNIGDKTTGYPLEYDGSRWLFERPTSAHVANELEKKIASGKFTKDIDSRKLSAPRDKGLIFDANDNSYIKVNNQYISIKSHKGNLYSITDNSGNKSYLRYKNGQFSPETLGERLQRIKEIGLSGRGEGIIPLIPKEIKLSEFDISNGGSDLLFPEYDIKLYNQSPDLQSYTDRFNALPLNEREALQKWTQKPINDEYPDSLILNQRLREGNVLDANLRNFDDNLSQALKNNLPQKKGDLIRFETYLPDEKNPWLDQNGKLTVGDYISDNGYLSFSGKDTLVKNVLTKGMERQKDDVACIVFYKVRGSKNGFYLPEGTPATSGKNIDEVLYKKDSKFKIVNISTARSNKEGTAHRVAVELEEVPERTSILANVERWHVGKSRKTDMPADFSLSLSDLLNSSSYP